MKILVINGPNLNLLGVREPELYGRRDFAALEAYIRASCRELGAECELFQSNHEGAIVDAIQSALGRMDGIVINPAAYTHTSVAILDALKAVALPGGGGASHRYSRARELPARVLRGHGVRKDVRRAGL